ncbi:MAG TPA: ABC transporter substrate-binding protein [Pilimelia sp.]|nr:ABC transporter substrate-binding protein [Pilimelia sp.]
MGLVIAGCTSAGGTGDGAGGGGATVDELKIGTFLDVTSWDPANADIGFDGPYLSAVYDPLVALDKDSKPVPALATSWEWSPDLRTLTMKLRTDATFTDGQKFDAAAAVKNLRHLKAGVRSNQAYANVADFAAVDASTLRITMKKRDDALLYQMGLGRSWMASPAAVGNDSLNAEPVGSGPYAYDKAQSTKASQYVFTRKAEHWDGGTYPFRTVRMFPITDQTASMNAMLSGQLNVNFANAADIPRARENGWNVASTRASWVGIQFVDRTGTQLKPLGDVRVRQAICYAFDGAAILKAVGNDAGVATNQLFPEGRGIYDAALNSRYATSLDKAKQLLTEAGYPNGFEVTMPMSPIFQGWQPAATQTFEKLGIRVKWRDMSMPDYMKNAPTYPMFLAVIAMSSNDMATVNDHITSVQWYNPRPSVDAFPEIRSLAAQVEAATGEEQAALIRRLNAALVEQAFQNVWYQADNTYFSVKGVTVTPITGMMFPTLRFIQRG